MIHSSTSIYSLIAAIAVSGCAADIGGGVDGDIAVATRDHALTIAVTDVIDTDDYTDIEIFSLPQPLPPGTTIGVEFDDTVQGPRTLVDLTEDSWLLFADLSPGHPFEHPTKIILVAAFDGTVTTFDAGWWPLIDGEERWRTWESRELLGEKVFSKLSQPLDPGAMRTGGATVQHLTTPAYCQPQDIQKWALAVVGSDDMATEPSIARNLALLLKTRGYHAQVLTPNNMPQGVATVKARLAAIRHEILLAPDAGYCDEFVLIWNGHGSKSGTLLIENVAGQKTRLTTDDLAIEVDKTTEHIEGMQVRVVIDSCFSGVHFARMGTRMPVDPNITGPDDLVRDVHLITSSSATELSAGDALPGNTFLEDMHECIVNQGLGVDFSAAFNCAKNAAISQTPQQNGWWNDGD